MCCRWKWIENWSLIRQLIFMFSMFALVSLVIFFLVTGLAVTITVGKYSSDTTNDLLDQSTNQMAAIVGDGSRLLDFKLMKLTEWMTIVSAMNQDMTRNDYCYGLNGTSYMDYSASTLSPPITYLPQYNGGLSALSFSHSSYHVPNKSPSDIVNFTDAIKNDIRKSTVTDPTVKRCFVAGGDFLSIYTGYQNTGVNREYPGVATPSFSTVKAYDPRNEDWYVDATEQPFKSGSTTQREPAYSSAYYDQYVQQFMITIGQSFNSLANSQVYGASGGDVTLSQLQNVVTNIKYLTSVSMLFERSTGSLIAYSAGTTIDRTGLNAVDIPTYANVRKPTMSSTIWDTVIGMGGTKPGVIELFGGADGDYFFVVQFLTTGTSATAKYVLVCSISRSDALTPTTSVTSDINDYKQKVTTTLSIVFVVAVVVVLACIWYFASQFVGPLAKLAQHVDNISASIGTPNAIAMPIDEQKNGRVGGLVDEQVALSAAYSEVVRLYNAGRKEASESTLPVNPYFGQLLPFYYKQNSMAPKLSIGEKKRNSMSGTVLSQTQVTVAPKLQLNIGQPILIPGSVVEMQPVVEASAPPPAYEDQEHKT